MELNLEMAIMLHDMNMIRLFSQSSNAQEESTRKS